MLVLDATFWREQCKLVIEKFDEVYKPYQGKTAHWERYRPVVDHVEGVLEILEREKRKSTIPVFLEAVFACLTAYTIEARHAAFTELVRGYYDLMMRAKLEREIIKRVGYGVIV